MAQGFSALRYARERRRIRVPNLPAKPHDLAGKLLLKQRAASFNTPGCNRIPASTRSAQATATSAINRRTRRSIPIVEQHLPTLRDELQRHETSLPRFVLSEFQDYLRCGRPEHGFVRVKCNGCRHEHLVSFSCKRRGFCPSCGARRMIETSAHLVDHVFPEVPVRQWVLSFPWPLRLLFASRPDALGRCLAVIVRAIQTDLAHRAGLTASTGARTGVVTLIQRFGSALNLNIHLHMLILDGVYTLEQNGPRFHRVGAPDAPTFERLLNRLIRRIVRRLTRDGLLIEDPEQPWLDLEPSDTLDHLNAASIRYRIAVGQGTAPEPSP